MKRCMAFLLTASLVLSSLSPQAAQALSQTRLGSTAKSPRNTDVAALGSLPALNNAPGLWMPAFPLLEISKNLSADVSLPQDQGPGIVLHGVAPLIDPAQPHAVPGNHSETAAHSSLQTKVDEKPGSMVRQLGPQITALGEAAHPIVENILRPDTGLNGALHQNGESLEELLVRGKIAPPIQGHEPIPEPTRFGRLGRHKPWLAKALGATLLFGAFGPMPFTHAPVTAQAPAQPQAPGEALTPPKPLAPAPISVSVAMSPETVTVGETVKLALTLRNDSPHPITIPSLRAAIKKALNENGLEDNLELQEGEGSQELSLESEETRTLTFEFIPYDAPLSPKELRPGAIAQIRLRGVQITLPAQTPGGAQTMLTLPEAVFSVRTSLTQERITSQGKPNFNLKDIQQDVYGVQRAPTSQLGRWAAIALVTGLMLWLAQRMLKSRPAKSRPMALKSVTQEARREIALLEQEFESLSAAAFYDRLWEILSELLTGMALPNRVYTEEGLIRELRTSGQFPKDFSQEQITQIIDRAEKLAQAAAIRHDPLRREKVTIDERSRHLKDMKEVLNLLSSETPPMAPPSSATPMMGVLLGLGLFPAGLEFGNPIALLLLPMVTAYLLWQLIKIFSRKFVRHKTSSAVAVSSLSAFPRKKSLRQRLLWLPGALLGMAALAAVLAIAKPEHGIEFMVRKFQTVYGYLQPDVSGSMDAVMRDVDGGQIIAREAAMDATRQFTIAQRRGRNTHLAIGEFSDKTYTYVRVTGDYDAIIAATKETESHGNTAIGEAIQAGVVHFFEVNAYDSDAADPRIREIQRLIGDDKTSEAIRYAQQHTDLLEKLLKPKLPKFIVLFSDGGHNTGIHPFVAAKTAADLGIRVYVVGVNTSGNDELMLQEITRLSGATRPAMNGKPASQGYYRVGDAEGMRRALQSIDELERAEIEERVRTVKDYRLPLILIALGSASLAYILASTRLRTLRNSLPVLLLLTLPFSAGAEPRALSAQAAPGNAAPIVAAQTLPKSIGELLLPSKTPPELLEANEHYSEGRYVEAIRAYARARRAHPDIPEILFNTGNAYLFLGGADNWERAQNHYQQYLVRLAELEQKAGSPEDKAAIAEKRAMTLYNQGNMALLQRDLGKAIQFYKQALKAVQASSQAPRGKPEDLHLRIQQYLEMAQRLKQEQNGQGRQGRPRTGQQQGQGQGQQGQGQQRQNQGQGQQGQGNQQGNTGDQQGNAQGPPSGERIRQGLDSLQKGQAETEQGQGQGYRQIVPRQGGQKLWAFAPLPLALSILSDSHNMELPWSIFGIPFTDPIFLGIGAGLVVLLAIFMLRGMLKRLKAARALKPREAPANFSAWRGRRPWALKAFFALASIALFSIAAADPMGGEIEKKHSFGGKNIAVLVDGSWSMDAKDKRLTHAQKELLNSVEHMQGTDRIGLVYFSGVARTASPPSTDYKNFIFKIRKLQAELRMIRQKSHGKPYGSNIGGAIEHAILKTFANIKKVGDRKNIIILISDGDIVPEQKEELGKAIQLAKNPKNPVIIYAIGVGSPEGSAILVPTPDGQGFEELIDEQTKKPALTRLDMSTLQYIAHSTGGEAFHSKDGSSIGEIWRRIAQMEAGTEFEVMTVPHSLADYFLWPGLLLLILSWRIRPHPILPPNPQGNST